MKHLQHAVCISLLSLCATAWSQQSANESEKSSTPAVNEAKPTMLAERQERNESAAIFHVKTNLVLAPVVVRDRNGKAVGSLTKQNFIVYDNGKPMPVKLFEVETPASRQQRMQKNATEVGGAESAPEQTKPGVNTPTRFVSYVFDDVHMDNTQLGQIRNAVIRQLKQMMRPGDRVAFYTTSGDVSVDFTNDSEKLLTAINSVAGKVFLGALHMECPRLNEYTAWRIEDAGFSGMEYAFAMEEVKSCKPQQTQPGGGGQAAAGCTSSGDSTTNTCDPNSFSNAATVREAVGLVINRNQHDTQRTLDVLRAVSRRLSTMPGERAMVLLSPGFYVHEQHTVNDIIDAAARTRILVNAVDVRGLLDSMATGGADDNSTEGLSSNLMRLRQQYGIEGEQAQVSTIADLAEATGGKLSRNNDFDGALTRAIVSPDYTYMIGFAPQNMKHDGSYHKIKIVIEGVRGLDVQARRGYIAPLSDGNPEQQMQSAVREAMFSQDEVREIPVSLQTQFYKTADYKATIGMLLSADLGAVPMKHADGRYNDSLGFYAAVFDVNGNYVTGMGKTIDLHLKEETAKRLSSNIVVRGALEVQSGNYLLRVVLRDSEGEQVSAISRTINIP